MDVVDAETYATFEALAQATKIETPAHILFLGDSLTDQLRGHNYTDMVGFWLRKVHGDVTYRNAGVGGDYITRVWQRMTESEGAYRPEMYEGLFAPTPTHVFIFLGHNDSKLKPKPEYRTPEDYPLTRWCRWTSSRAPHPVTGASGARAGRADAIISATSSVHGSRATVIKRIAANGNGGLALNRTLERPSTRRCSRWRSRRGRATWTSTPQPATRRTSATCSADGVHNTRSATSSSRA